MNRIFTIHLMGKKVPDPFKSPINSGWTHASTDINELIDFAVGIISTPPDWNDYFYCKNLEFNKYELENGSKTFFQLQNYINFKDHNYLKDFNKFVKKNRHNHEKIKDYIKDVISNRKFIEKSFSTGITVK